jgi:uncharacterized DUF497 family protein
MLEFEWDDGKARANERKHGITFERAKLAFADPFAIIVFDDREAYGEERYNLIGAAAGPLLFVAYTERGNRVRIIFSPAGDPIWARGLRTRSGTRLSRFVRSRTTRSWLRP